MKDESWEGSRNEWVAIGIGRDFFFFIEKICSSIHFGIGFLLISKDAHFIVFPY